MQMSQQMIPIAAMYDHLFDQKRKENRVEFVSDFPDGNDAEVVSALQVKTKNIYYDDYYKNSILRLAFCIIYNNYLFSIVLLFYV